MAEHDDIQDEPTFETKLEELLDRGYGPVGANCEVSFGLDDGPLADLGKMLTKLNGFYAFNSGIHIFHVGDSERCTDLLTWNDEATWKQLYQGLADDLFCFGQDIFGMQFAVRNNTNIVVWNPETCEDEESFDSLEDWAAWLLEDPNVNGAAGFAKEYQDAKGGLEMNQRLVPLTLFMLGGAYDQDNLVPRDAVEGMKIRGPLAVKLRDLPDGTTIKLEVVP